MSDLRHRALVMLTFNAMFVLVVFGNQTYDKSHRVVEPSKFFLDFL